MYLLIRRNTRRYGGYIIHIGVVIVVIGLAGAAFNRSEESELALHDTLPIGPYTLECRSGFTQDSNLNYNSEYAILDVYRNGKKQFQMTPEKRVYLASDQPQTMVAIHSVPGWDLYVVYEGTNPDTGQPIIKAFLNPLVSWIWAGVVFIVVRHVCRACAQPDSGHCRLARAGTRTAPPEPALQGRRLMASRNSIVVLSGQTSAGIRESNNSQSCDPERSAFQRSEGPALKDVRSNRQARRSTFFIKSAQALLLAIAVCFSIGASDSGSRFNDLNHRLMCHLRVRAASRRMRPCGLPCHADPSSPN